PMVWFVYNVLKRSRTSGPVLQIALCYLEAIRHEVSNLIRRDNEIEPDSEEPVNIRPIRSPLLCPLRAFLAAVILANKFTNDMPYSNRAWAQLPGLSARELSRSELALCASLDWRLCVGK
ncbi:hypothetical protein B0H13DRAFT_1451107, partial [Mycena leptocephala]